MRRFLLFLPLVAVTACGTTSAEYLDKQRGYDVIRGFVISVRSLESPEREQLKDGVAYTITTEGCTVVMEFESRMPGSLRRQRLTYELKPGDRFIQSRPYSFVLLKRGR